MSNYKLLLDENELKTFFDIAIPELELFQVYFLSLSARNKYLDAEERELYNLGRTEMFARKIIRERSFDKLVSTLKKFESREGSYLTKNGSNMPEKVMVVY